MKYQGQSVTSLENYGRLIHRRDKPPKYPTRVTRDTVNLAQPTRTKVTVLPIFQAEKTGRSSQIASG